jgi:DNA invertase Pin-like site-specific DNA recombinase
MGSLDPFWHCVPLARINVELKPHAGRICPCFNCRSGRRLGVERIFQEQVSAVGSRPQLEACLDFVREGDVLIVTRLDRLCRSTAHFCEVFDRLERKRVAIRVLDLGIDTTSPTGRMIAEIVAVAGFERRLLLERQRVGIGRGEG